MAHLNEQEVFAVAEFEAAIKAHYGHHDRYAIFIKYNDHSSSYTTAQEVWDDPKWNMHERMFANTVWANQQDKTRAIENNTVWRLVVVAVNGPNSDIAVLEQRGASSFAGLFGHIGTFSTSMLERQVEDWLRGFLSGEYSNLSLMYNDHRISRVHLLQTATRQERIYYPGIIEHILIHEDDDARLTPEQLADKANFVSVEEMNKAIQDDSCWTFQWYPHTPVGSYTARASSLVSILNTEYVLD